VTFEQSHFKVSITRRSISAELLIKNIGAPHLKANSTHHVYNFGPFSLNQTERQLLRHGEPMRLPPKAFDVLLVLIQNRACLVTKEQLLHEVWPDAFVEKRISASTSRT